MIQNRPTRGFLLVEAALAVALVTIVTLTSVDLTAKAMLATNWTTHIALANAYLDREAALLRRLDPNDLSNRGYIVGGPDTTNYGGNDNNGITSSNVPLAFFTNNPDTPDILAPDATFSADSVIRDVTVTADPTNNLNDYTYTVTLNMTLHSDAETTKVYTQSRMVTRSF